MLVSKIGCTNDCELYMHCVNVRCFCMFFVCFLFVFLSFLFFFHYFSCTLVRFT